MMEMFLAVLILCSEVQDRESLRFVYSLEQGHDDSCGLQVLACLLDVYWGFPADEEGLADELRGIGRRRDGLTVSFGELSLLLSRRGFIAEAWQMGYEGLAEACRRWAPVIVHLALPEGHFALLLEADEKSTVLADPASGLVVVEREDFQTCWTGMALLVARPGAVPPSATIRAAVESVRGPERLLEKAARRLPEALR
jgi:hypothetical protein